jgi:hypothetical protein
MNLRVPRKRRTFWSFQDELYTHWVALVTELVGSIHLWASRRAKSLNMFFNSLLYWISAQFLADLWLACACSSAVTVLMRKRCCFRIKAPGNFGSPMADSRCARHQAVVDKRMNNRLQTIWDFWNKHRGSGLSGNEMAAVRTVIICYSTVI